MRKRFFLIPLVFSAALSQTLIPLDPHIISVPMGGNAWVTVKPQDSAEMITDKGVKNWTDHNAKISAFIKLRKSGSIKISAVMRVPDGKNAIQCTVNGRSFVTIARGPEWTEYPFGTWDIAESGYVRIDLQGMKRSGKYFAEISELRLSGTAVDSAASFVRNNEENYFYWGRRGPSVHINYSPVKDAKDVEWFYNEITVPEGNDVIGSFFMSNGFSEGYFGMQVNSKTERRILFSVWSPFRTDDPSAVPIEKRVLLKKKGIGVQTGEFGNEGSGGQSYLVFPWKTGVTYRFLLHASPKENGQMLFSAYFFAPESARWMLIASFSRPDSKSSLTRLHSFLENFELSTGHITRKALYGNQWVKDIAGEWHPLTEMTFTADATALKGYRLDYKGGTDGVTFFLQNCGFFNDQTSLRSRFIRSNEKTHPPVETAELE